MKSFGPRKKIYFAAPLFSEAEQSANQKLSEMLEVWCDVFLPQRDGELVPHLIEAGSSAEQAFRVVFARDIAAINACDAVVVHLDGRTVDEGASFELGYAFALEKICVGYRTDPRVLLPWGLNPMIIAPLQQIFGNATDLANWAKSFAQNEWRPARAIR